MTVSARLDHIWRMGATLAECPVWVAPRRQLAWVDGVACSYHLLDPGSGEKQVFAMPAKIGSAAPLAEGGAVVALAGGLAQLDPGGRLTPLSSPVSDGIVFNDGKCDAAGRFWIGSRSADGSGGGGALFRFEPERGAVQVRPGFDVCNGMGWSPDGGSFYLIDTVPHHLYRFGFDAGAGAIDEGVLLHRFDGRRGKPDGMAVDSAGRLWCAMWDGGGIAVLSPDGALAGWIDVPATRPTNCAFGGEDLRTLFVTTASIGIDPDDPRKEAGAILQYSVEVPGAPVTLFEDKTHVA